MISFTSVVPSLISMWLPLKYTLCVLAAIGFTASLSRASGTEFLAKDIFAAAVSPDCACITSCSKQRKTAQVSLRASSKDGGAVQVQQKPRVSGSRLVQSSPNSNWSG